MNNITYRRQSRKSLLGTRMSILRNNGVILEVEPNTDCQQESTNAPKPDLDSCRENSERISKNRANDKESANFILKNINSLLEKNNEALELLLNERQQLKKLEEILENKMKDERMDVKENQPPKNNPFDCDFPSKDNDEIKVPQNPIIEEMRSSIKFLKTPKLTRKTRQSILLTPHSMSFRIQKQFEELLE